jgi:hypothetical protein
VAGVLFPVGLDQIPQQDVDAGEDTSLRHKWNVPASQAGTDAVLEALGRLASALRNRSQSGFPDTTPNVRLTKYGVGVGSRLLLQGQYSTGLQSL